MLQLNLKYQNVDDFKIRWEAVSNRYAITAVMISLFIHLQDLHAVRSVPFSARGTSFDLFLPTFALFAPL